MYSRLPDMDLGHWTLKVNKKNTSTLLKIEGMHCASCQRPIEKVLRETPGVTDVSVNLASREVTVECTVSSDVLVAAVASVGFDAAVDPLQSLQESDRAGFRALIGKSVLALGSGVLLMVFGMQAGAIGTAWNLAQTGGRHKTPVDDQEWSSAL
jgi:copper chaperone CopZ